MDEKRLAHLAALAGLELGPAERRALALDLARIGDLVRSLPALDSTAADPAPGPEELPARSAERGRDCACDRGLVEAAAPAWDDGRFLVPPPTADDREAAP